MSDDARIHDGSPPGPIQSEASVQAGASDRTDETPPHRRAAGQAPVPGVFVSYEEFKTRRQLPRRVMTAVERLDREDTLDGEFRAVSHLQAPATCDDTF